MSKVLFAAAFLAGVATAPLGAQQPMEQPGAGDQQDQIQQPGAVGQPEDQQPGTQGQQGMGQPPAAGEQQMGAGESAQQSEAASAQDLTAEVVVAEKVQDLEPVGEADEFTTETDMVVGWSRVEGAEQPTQVVHVWKHEGREVDRIPLDVKSESYRTYSRKSLHDLPGEWELEVQNEQGEVIGETSFQLVRADQSSQSPAGASPSQQQPGQPASQPDPGMQTPGAQGQGAEQPDMQSPAGQQPTTQTGTQQGY